MPTLGEVRARLRRALEDTDTVAPLWDDTELNEALATAHREYGARFPREVTATLNPVGGQTDYALPADARRVVRVESPAGQPLPRRAPSVGHEPGAAQTWAYSGGLVRLGLPPDDPLVVLYRGLYPFPAGDGDDFALPDEGVDLAVAGAVVLALQRREVAAAKRRGGASPVGVALAQARRGYADALARCRRARGDVLAR
ncbi:MAG TPA: hypothetical protein VFW96_17585 [Thermomicrobiales bacterium]|nr:hypothetical protein [Thermomicrobiales bacterium]